MSEVAFLHDDNILGGYIVCCMRRIGLQEKREEGTPEDGLPGGKNVIIHWAQSMPVLFVLWKKINK